MIPVPQGIDFDQLIKPDHVCLIAHRKDGSWRVSYHHTNPRLRKKTVTAEGIDFADALSALDAKLGAMLAE